MFALIKYILLVISSHSLLSRRTLVHQNVVGRERDMIDEKRRRDGSSNDMSLCICFDDDLGRCSGFDVAHFISFTTAAIKTWGS